MHHHFRALRPKLRRALAPTAAATAVLVAATLTTVPTAGATSGVRGEVSSVSRIAGAAATTTATTTATAAATTLARARRDGLGFTPKTGIITTDPRRADRRKLLEHIIKSIGSTKRRQKIRFISWNVASTGFVDKLIAAHKRGVSVRLLMAGGKTEGNGDYWRLKNALQRTRPNTLPPKYKSWARACNRSCRGTRGIAHSKLFLFSKVGRAPRVVMSTSANATEVAVNYQWNDLFTQVGSKPIYRGFMRAFRESVKDQPVRHAYRTFGGRSATGYVYPWKGRGARGDRVMKELKRITCVSPSGRTRIRIAQDAILDDRGIEIAKILRTKWENGCNIRIVYALMGRQVLTVLRNTSRGPVPIQQVVSDFDGDGVYDRYLHAKVMAVRGWYRNDRSARVAWQGSENWSGLAKISDEQGLKLNRASAEGRYAGWVDYLFTNPPPVTRATTMRVAAQRDVDPYALIREELGLPARQP